MRWCVVVCVVAACGQLTVAPDMDQVDSGAVQDGTKIADLSRSTDAEQVPDLGCPFFVDGKPCGCEGLPCCGGGWCETMGSNPGVMQCTPMTQQFTCAAGDVCRRCGHIGEPCCYGCGEVGMRSCNEGSCIREGTANFACRFGDGP